MYYYNGAQRYEQFLQVGQLHNALILLRLALCLTSASVIVSLVFMIGTLAVDGWAVIFGSVRKGLGGL